MRLFRVTQIHKIAGLLFGAVLFILALSGFFLNHDNYDFLWKIRIGKEYLPDSVHEKTAEYFEAFKVDNANPQRMMASSRLGFFLSNDGGRSFERTLYKQVLAIEPYRFKGAENFDRVFIATTDGVYESSQGGRCWRLLALGGQPVTSISVVDGFVNAVVDKRSLYRINIQSGIVEHLEFGAIDDVLLPDEITLGRFVRDLHYGRGLFSGDSSLLINDFAAFVLLFLPVGGLVIYLSIRGIRLRKSHNKQLLFSMRALHSNKLILFSFIPITLLLITGVLLDHTKLFRPFLKSTVLNTGYLPPVYHDLSTDIWAFDYDGETYRIGNRLGLFKSNNLTDWRLESKGFVWRLKRVGNGLYIAGMGAPNRYLAKDGWQVLKGHGHMPRDFFNAYDGLHAMSTHHLHFPLPTTDRVPLYHLMLALHDGEFFHEYWVLVNDAASIAALLLLITGFIKWRVHNGKHAKRDRSRNLESGE